ncbi:hypothetical protein EI94DRAFT_1759513 [Lactarius quietus]|nr:hypothetical protein EI94DRAFT_1759513 [Lactarius quietus]
MIDSSTPSLCFMSRPLQPTTARSCSTRIPLQTSPFSLNFRHESIPALAGCYPSLDACLEGKDKRGKGKDISTEPSENGTALPPDSSYSLVPGIPRTRQTNQSMSPGSTTRSSILSNNATVRTTLKLRAAYSAILRALFSPMQATKTLSERQGFHARRTGELRREPLGANCPRYAATAMCAITT